MTPHTTEPSPQVYARVAGVLYLSRIPFEIFGMQYVPSLLLVPGDAAATARNILASESLFRLGIVSNLLGPIVVMFVVLALYQVLKPVNKNMAGLMVIFLLLGVPIAMLDELNQLAILLLLHGADHVTGFTADQMHALVPLLLNVHDNGLNIAVIFFGLWLLPMGYLVFRSGFLPRILGVLLLISGVGFLIQSFAAFLFPNFNVDIPLFTDWGELVFALWLVIRGVNVEQWAQRARASA